MAGNTKNLKMFTSEQSREKAKENGRKGGIKSGEVKRAKKELRQCFEALLESNVLDKKTGEEMSGAEAAALTVFRKALKGDLKAFELLRDTAGQKPIEKVAIGDVTADVINEVENMVLGDKE